LYVNRGDGTFREASQEQNLRSDGRGLGVVLVDVDGNHQPDVYIANDASPNFLYVNRNGRLEEVGRAAGVALDEDGSADGSMGVDAGDFDGDGRPDLWVTNFQQELHALYANRGGGLFLHESRAAGVAALGRQFVGFGTAFADLDQDGWEDLLVVNGHVRRHPAGASFRQRGVLLQNVDRRGRRFFQDVSSAGGEYFSRELLGRGLAIGDLDNDGWPDVAISHSNSPVVLLQNRGQQFRNHHWLGIELIGKEGRDVTGSTVTLEVAGRKITRFAKAGGSYLSSSDRRLVFGLGETAQAGRLTVRWSWGAAEHWDGLRVDAYHQLREGEANVIRPGQALPAAGESFGSSPPPR
jgi:enediyne biosynthesis protein E4